jgi:hypothetical protein
MQVDAMDEVRCTTTSLKCSDQVENGLDVSFRKLFYEIPQASRMGEDSLARARGEQFLD